MKRLVVILSLVHFFASFAFGEIYAFKDAKDRFVYFEESSEKPTDKNQKIYYKYASKSSSMRFETTGFIQVSFENSADAEEFATKNSLKDSKSIEKNIYIFKNNSSFDDVILCSKLWEQTGVVYARPLFKSKKRLQ